MMGLVYNDSVGAYLMSRYGEIKDNVWERLVSEVFSLDNTRLETLEARVRKNRPNDINWKTGPALFSALLPETFHYNYKDVFIKNGVLIKGNITESVVGPSTKSIVHMLCHHYGNQVGSQFISEGHHLTNRFIEYTGFSVGYRDCVMPSGESKVKEIVDKKIIEIETELKNLAPLAWNKNAEIRNFYNQTKQAKLDAVKVIGQEIIVSALKSDNALKIMADSGSKGKPTDIAQINGIVGQQFIKGELPPLHFNKEASPFNPNGEGTRFLPYYDVVNEMRSMKIENQGFVKRPLGKGMRPGQFVAHMMASRDSIIDIALGTADTGYSHHTISKALEDLRYSYNGTICGDQGNVIQYAGGGDSYEPSEMMEVKVPGYGNIWTPIDIPYLMDMLNDED
jgi:DNA-directed RNA polymerase beta' subunit